MSAPHGAIITPKSRSVRMAMVSFVVIIGLQGFMALLPSDSPPVGILQVVIPTLLLLICMTFGHIVGVFVRTTGTPYLDIFGKIATTSLAFFVVLWLVSFGIGLLPPTPANQDAGQHIHDYATLVHTLLGTTALGWWASIAYCAALCTAGLPRPTMADYSPRMHQRPKWLVVVGLLLMALGLIAIFQYPEIAQRMNIPLPVSAGLWTVGALASIAHSYIDCRQYDRADRQRRLIRHATSHRVTS